MRAIIGYRGDGLTLCAECAEDAVRSGLWSEDAHADRDAGTKADSNGLLPMLDEEGDPVNVIYASAPSDFVRCGDICADCQGGLE
jgi:hypothetical protein